MAVPAISVTVASTEFSSGFAGAKATDRDVTTYWVANASTGWLRVQLASSYAATGYRILSNVAEPARAPQAWTFEGSNDASSWTTLDTRSGQSGWANKGQQRSYSFTNTTAYTYYRLNVSANNGDSFLAFTELYVDPAPAIYSGAGSYASAVAADAPAVWLRMSETSGAVVADSSGNGYQGNLTGTYTRNGTSLISSDADPSLVLSGAASSGASVPAVPANLPSTGFAFEAIIKPAAVSAYMLIVNRDYGGVGSDRFWQFRVTPTGQLDLLWWNSAGTLRTLTSAAGLIVAGTTYHVAATYDGTTARIFINGTQVGSLAQSGNVRSDPGVAWPIWVGVNREDTGTFNFPFNGTLDEVAVYTAALSPTRVAVHAAAVTAASAAVSVAAPVLAVVEAVPAPVVTAGAKVSIAAPALAVAAALLAPTVTAGTGVRVDAPTLAVSTSVAAPVVTMAANVSVNAPTLGVVATVPAPTVTAGSSVTVTAPTLGVLTSMLAPTVSTTDLGSVNVAAPHLSLVTAMPEAAVTGILPTERAVTSLTHTPVGILSVVPLVPVSPLAQAVPVTRTSILAPVLSEAYPAHPEQGADGAPEVVREVVGYPQLWISGQNVTNLRGVPTILRRWESEAPFGDTVAACEFPQLNPWDAPGTGDLAFLRKDAPVQIGMREEVSPGVVRVRRLWSGFLDARGNGLGDGEDYSWEAKGTFWQAQSQIREPVAIVEPVDIGVQIARTLNAVEGRRWKAMPLTPIGITTLTRGSRDESFWDYVQALLSEAITDDLRQWTLTEIAVGIPRLALKPAPSTVHATVAYGTPGVDIDLRVDESTRIDRIKMRGIGPKGGGWANVYYPGIELLAVPPYPMAGFANITAGTTDADTTSGTGVTDWQRRVSEIKSFGNPPVSGVMSSAWVAIVDDLQRRVGVTADGSLGPQTWNATFDRAISGIDMTPVRLPMASKPEANKWLHSAAGVKLGLNPVYDPTLVVREAAIDVGPGKSKAQGFKLARKLLGVYGNAAANGQIVWTTDPNETDRTRLSHLSNIKVKGFEGSDRVVQVSSKTVELEAGDDGPVYVVTTRVDERARDAMAVEDLLEQRRSAMPDPSRNPSTPNRASRAVSDQRTPWDSESPCGVLRRTAVNGSSGLWSVVTIPFAEVGKLAGFRFTSDRPFMLGIFASLRITENKLASRGNPWTADDFWRDNKAYFDDYGVIEAFGQKDQALGYSPKTEGDGPFTGEWTLDTPMDYWSETVPYVSVAIHMRGGSGWIEGEFIPAYEP